MENSLPVSVNLPAHGLASWPVERSATSLFDQLLAFRRRWRMILAVTLLLPALALLALSRMPPHYTATGILLYDPADSAPPGVETAQGRPAAAAPVARAGKKLVVPMNPATNRLAGRS